MTKNVGYSRIYMNYMYCIIYVTHYLKSSFFNTLQCIQRTYGHKTETKYMYIISTLNRH